MVLNRLLWDCLNQDTSVAEHNVGIAISPNPGERVLFFRIDPARFKKRFGLRDDTALCDVIVFYRRNGLPPQFIFIELKSDDVSHAERQIRETAAAIKNAMPPLEPKPTYSGLILTRSGAHQSRNRKRDKGAKSVSKELTDRLGFPVQQKGDVRGKANLRDFKVLS
jgi:hypothetical protein